MAVHQILKIKIICK